MSSDIKLEALAPKDDLLPEEGTSFGVYYQSLSSAFSNSKIRNIALSGSLGSGKSSIIRSFDRERNGEKRFIYVSLIDFSRAVANDEGKPYDQQQLEASLLDQILSYCTSDKIPEGAIRGIPEKFEFLDFSAKTLTLLGLSAFVLIFHEKFGKLAAMFGAPDYLRSNFHVMLYLFAAIVLCGFVYRILLRCLPLLQISKLLVKSSVAEAEVELGKKRPSLDTHKFELAYILERIGEDHDYTVVFEDLERLDDATAVSIMTKLRELNTLTNNHLQAQGSSHPIRFLYAISDSTMPAEYRTKFYDCIIPVIPVSHPLNSQVKLQKILNALGFSEDWKDHLCDALSDAFVDYRTLLSLRNEFQVLQALYGAESNHTNGDESASQRNAPFLFAITAYRILLPKWFERTLSPQGDGILPDFSSDDEKAYFEEKGWGKAHGAVRKLFDSGLLDKTSMRLIIGEQALIEQWMKVIRYALDTETFKNGDEKRIRSITEALQVVFRDTHLTPHREPYAEFRKAMYERLCTLIYKKDSTQFILVANSLAAVSRADTADDWVWRPARSDFLLTEFSGFLQNYLSWLDALSEGPEPKEYPYAIRCLKALCEHHPEYREHVLQCATELLDSSETPDRNTIARLKNLWDACPENPAVALQYAKALAKLAYEQELPELADTIALLKNVRDAFPDDQEIALEYAKRLVTLSYHQKLPECADTVTLLKDLREAFSDNQEIVLQYAKGLVNLSAKQQLPDRAKTIDLLKNLREAYPDNQEIAHLYAMGLVNLSAKQQLPDRAKTIDLLKNLREAFPDNQEIAHQYAMGLFNLAFEQQLPEIADTVDLLKKLWEAFPDNQEIAHEYAKGLVNLSAKQQLPEIADTVDLLKNLWEAFPDNQEIAHEYAMGLVNLSIEQQLPNRAKTIDLLKNLREAYPDNQEIALRYAMGLFNLSAKQQLPDRAKTIDLLKNLREAFPDNQEIALRYAMGLVNLSAKQQLPDRAKTIDLLKNLREAFPDNQEIAHQYAMGLFNLSFEQQLPEIADTVDLLKKLWEAFPDNQEIAHEYAMGLVNLSTKQQLPEIADTVDLLKNLWEAFPDNQEIALRYAMGLVNLSAKQQLPDRAKTIDLLKKLREAFPDNQEIAHQYAMGLFNLSIKQQLPEIADTVDLLKKLREAYPDNQKIALRYAMGLYNLTWAQEEGEIPATVMDIVDLLWEYPGIIPECKEKIESHLSRNPDRKKLYRPLLALFDGAAASP